MYIKRGNMCAAKGIFDEFCDKNLVVYNTIIWNYVQHRMAGKVLVLSVEMLREGLRSDKVTCYLQFQPADSWVIFLLGSRLMLISSGMD